MKSVKTTLIALFPIIILLLLLGTCDRSGCDRDEGEGYATAEPVEEVEEPVDEPIQQGGEDTPQEVEEQAQEVGASGEIKVTLLWDFIGDIDLHVVEPSGNEINFMNKVNRRTGAKLDVDNRNGGRSGGRSAAENIAWQNADHGNYRVFLEYYSESPRYHRATQGECKVVVFVNGQSRTYTVNMTYVHQREEICTFQY